MIVTEALAIIIGYLLGSIPSAYLLVRVLKGVDIRKFGSSGQHKSVVLSIKLAMIEIVKKESGAYPVLLLDEVFSELDKKHCVSMMEILKKKKLQVFFTANHFPKGLKEYFAPKTSVFTVVNGEIKETAI